MLWSDAKWRIERESVFPITCTRQIGDELPDENASLPLSSLYKFSGQEDFEMGLIELGFHVNHCIVGAFKVDSLHTSSGFHHRVSIAILFYG
jgi:hypothetical protein